MESNDILTKTEEFVYHLLIKKSPQDNVYHNITHTKEVVEAAQDIGIGSNLSKQDLEIVLITAWFHDVGYIDSAEEHEEQSAKYAKAFLNDSNYPKENTEKVISAILATKLPQEPKAQLEEVLCDADMQHLGKKTFFDKSELFRVETEKRTGQKLSDLEWLKYTLDFFTKQRFFTKYAKKQYEEGRNANLIKLQKRFRKAIRKLEEQKFQGEKLQVEKEKLDTKKGLDKKAERGIETMFRNTLRTHVMFSSMADSKANIMISVNTLLLGAIATILAGELDTNPHLIIPTIILSSVSLTTLIFGILVTRPKVTEGTFTKEDIEEKRANLLFFGNFFNMKLEDFTWGMKELMKDKDYLYGSMIKDFYYLGQVLGRKYKYLRICYNIFMYGLIISIISFAMAIALNPEGTEIRSIF